MRLAHCSELGADTAEQLMRALEAPVAAPAREDAAVPQDWLRVVEESSPQGAAFLAGWLSAHLALGLPMFPDREAFTAAFEHWAQTGRLITFAGADTPSGIVREHAAQLVRGTVSALAVGVATAAQSRKP